MVIKSVTIYSIHGSVMGYASIFKHLEAINIGPFGKRELDIYRTRPQGQLESLLIPNFFPWMATIVMKRLNQPRTLMVGCGWLS